MKRKKFAALLATAMMTISLISSTAFAEETYEIMDEGSYDEGYDTELYSESYDTENGVYGENDSMPGVDADEPEIPKLEGKLEFETLAWVGQELKPDFTKVIPETLNIDMVTCQWSRQTEDELIPLSAEKTYTVQPEDLGYRLLLMVTVDESFGYRGTLSMLTNVVTETEEEAKLNAESELIELDDFEQFIITPVETEADDFTDDISEDSISEDGISELELLPDFEENQESDNMESENGEITSSEEENYLYQEVPWSELEQEDAERDAMILQEAAPEEDFEVINEEIGVYSEEQLDLEETDDSTENNEEIYSDVESEIESEKTDGDENVPEDETDSENPESPTKPDMPTDPETPSNPDEADDSENLPDQEEPEDPMVGVPQIISVNQPAEINVAFGTSYDEIKAMLPSQISMIYRNGTVSPEEQQDQTGLVNVIWNEFTYDPTLEAGQTLTITGTADKTTLLDQNGETIPEEAVQDETILDTQISVVVAPKPYEAPKLVEIKASAAINDLPNGIAKDGARFGLPSAVTIVTTKGEMQAQVTWDVVGCSYDPSGDDPQSFAVEGVVTLPNDVEQNGVSLNTSIQVSVKGYAGSTPAESDSYISGIDGTADYTTQTQISFKAIGGGMDNSSPRKGDYRYLPTSWKVLESRHFSDDSYSSSFKIKKAGDYTLTVTYDEQVYNGNTWEKTGSQITRTADFHVIASEGDEEEQKKQEEAAKKKQSVKTGDETQIMPLVFALVGAVLIICGLILRRKIRK